MAIVCQIQKHLQQAVPRAKDRRNIVGQLAANYSIYLWAIDELAGCGCRNHAPTAGESKEHNRSYLTVFANLDIPGLQIAIESDNLKVVPR